MKMCRYVLALIVLIIPCLISCKKERQNEALTVYFEDTSVVSALIERAINKYEEKSGITVKVEHLPIYASQEEYDLFRDKQRAEFMAGKGPDVYIKMGEFDKSIYKWMDAGLFIDFNELINSDKSFSIEDYEQEVLKAGIYSNKQYIMPLTFSIPACVTTFDRLAKYGVTKRDFNGYEKFIDTTLMLQKNDEKLIINYNGDGTLAFSGWIKEALDLNDKKLQMDTKIFDKAIQVLQNEYVLNQKDNGEQYYEITHIDDNEKGLFIIGESTQSELAFLINAEDHIVELIPIPSCFGEKTAIVYQYCMISSFSNNIGNAWEFVKILLGDEYQKNIYKAGNGIGVSRAFVDYSIEQIVQSYSYFGVISEKNINQMKSYYKEYDNAIIWAIDEGKIIYYSFYEYIHSNTQKDIREVKKEVSNELNLWMSE